MIGRKSLSEIKGKRIQIAGSADSSVSIQQLILANSIVYNLVIEILSLGGGLVITLGHEPKKEDIPLIFDWTIIDAITHYLDQKEITQWKDNSSKQIIGVVYNKFKERIPQFRKELWKKLAKSNYFGLTVLPEVSSFGGNLRKIQLNLGDILIILGGSKGVYDLAKLYASNNKLVIPININLKKEGTIKILEEIYLNPNSFYPSGISEYIISLLNSYQIEENSPDISEIISVIIKIIESIKNIPYTKRSDVTVPSSKKVLLEPQILTILINDMATLQQINRIISREEDKYSLFLSALLNNSLKPYGYFTDIHDLSGKIEKSDDTNSMLGGLGELDIRILNSNRELAHICEALILRSINKNYTKEHLKKIFEYDAIGLPVNFMIVYSKVKYFSKLWGKYINLVNEFNFPYPLTKEGFKDLSNELSQYAEIKIGLTNHMREGRICKLYHFFLNFN